MAGRRANPVVLGRPRRDVVAGRPSCWRTAGRMVVQVQGIRTARRAAAIMQAETGVETGIHRGEETGAVYWVSNTHLLPPGEQRVLEELAGEMRYVAGCSHQLTATPVKQSRETIASGEGSTRSAGTRPKAGVLLPRTRARLLEMAREWTEAREGGPG